MKKTILTAAMVSSLTIASCNPKTEKSSTEKKPKNTVETVAVSNVAADVPFTEAKNYFVKNTFKEDQLTNPKISTQAAFDAIFGIARTMKEDGKPTSIDFTKQYVIAIVNPVTDLETKLSAVTLKQKDNAIILNYDVQEGEKQSYSTQPLLLLIVDAKYQGEIIVERNM
ncbi:hypothetical protein [Flavobacterium sp.]|uniref:hypothetical protein n=1 Tax=Flavobacterium sp. TaxID=239 RepID=UPI003D6A23B8